MRIRTVLGGVASSAVIGAMAVIYMTAGERAAAAINPLAPEIPVPAYQPERMLELEPVFFGLVTEPTIRPRARPRGVDRLPESAMDADQQYCLAQNIYFEARGEGRIGQEAVAWVTLNRVLDRRWPGTICAVVWQDSQFSWTHDGRSDRPKPGEQWDQAREIAQRVSQTYDPAIDPTEGSVMFHADRVSPNWSDSFYRVVQIDAHIFYR